jgi:NADH:ubiquinone oxidoreductase subunit 6 (subunit J)
MRKNKLKNWISLTFLSFASFLTVFGNNSVIYAQSGNLNDINNTIGDFFSVLSTPVFVFSLGLLIIVLCMVGVLCFNKKQGEDAVLKGQFEFQRLAFAAVILTGLGLVFLQSMAMYYWASPEQKEAAKSIFETCKTVIPPIITLVLGYYFGKSEQNQAPNNTNTEKQNQAPNNINTEKQNQAPNNINTEKQNQAPNNTNTEKDKQDSNAEE